MKATNTYDKMQLQRDFMNCWLTLFAYMLGNIK